MSRKADNFRREPKDEVGPSVGSGNVTSVSNEN